MALEPEVLSEIQEVMAGQVRAFQRSLAEVRADLLAHEIGHAGVQLPDAIGWVSAQWLQIPPPVRVYILVYAVGIIVALLRWLYRQFTTEKKPVAQTWGSVA